MCCEVFRFCRHVFRSNNSCYIAAALKTPAYQVTLTQGTSSVEVHLERDIGGKQREGKIFKEDHDEETHAAGPAVEEKQTENGTQV
jgi:hypothetical protein